MVQIEGRWWEAQELLSCAHGIRIATPRDEFYCDPNYRKVREAIVAAKFATRRPWNSDWQVRPVPDRERFPDVALRCGKDVRLFEIAEADREGRKRCAEYRAAKGLPPEWEYFDPEDEARTALDEIVRIIKKKAAKQYSPKPHLLVYVNLWPGEVTTLYAAGIHNLFGENFQSIWLLWGEATYRLSPSPARIKVG